MTDDGLPNPPASVTTTWLQVNGPGTVTFGNASAVDTTATFSEAGTYVLRLTANDSALTASDEVTITVDPESVNQAPTVNAGSDQSITLTSNANLDGTVTDDGLPTPPSLTTLWSQISGPGTVTFGNASAVDTNASFSAAGTYVLRLTADDSALTAFDEVTITINEPVNQAPTVNAGSDQSITLPGGANLDGTVTDDGLPNPPATVTTTWSQVSGPGAATFADAKAMATTASFSAAGTYVLRLTADDSALTAFDEVAITVIEVTGDTVEVRVASSSDDAEESGSGSVDLTSSDLDLGQKAVGMRFGGMSIPPGATIVNAYVAFTVDNTGTRATSVTIAGQAADNAPTFVANSGDITSRATTAASVNWSIPGWTTAGVVEQSPDLSAVVQEIVDRSGWASGNALVLIATNGTGKREAISFDANGTQAPLLHVEYTIGAP